MKKVACNGALAVALFACLCSVVVAQDGPSLNQEYAKLINASGVVGSLGSDLFGDSTNLYTGATEFIAVDVNLPGNSALPVSIARRFAVAATYGVQPQGAFGEWELDLPHLEGVFADRYEWQVSNPEQPNNRCTVNGELMAAPPPAKNGEGWFDSSEYWSGNHLHLPGQGSQEMLYLPPTNTNRPTDGQDYHWVTSANWVFACLKDADGMKNGLPGEAFLAVAPDGTKYFFNWAVVRKASTLHKALDALPMSSPVAAASAGPSGKNGRIQVSDDAFLVRDEVWIMPTRIEDRFGNYVEYTYSGDRLTAITGSDGRNITLAYDETSGRVSSVTAGERTWTYDYSASQLKVTRPDGSSWNYASEGTRSISYSGAEGSACGSPGSIQPSVYYYTVTHPSGAVGKFTFRPERHGRSYVRKLCVTNSDPRWRYDVYPKEFDTIGVIRKSITGPSLPGYTWNFAYGPTNSSYDEDCAGVSCPSSKFVEVSGPGSTFTRYTFGNRFRDNEGKLLQVEKGASATSIQQTETTTWEINPVSAPYPNPVGISPQQRGDAFASERIMPMSSRLVVQDGVQFSWRATEFDEFGNPKTVVKSNVGNAGGDRQRTETTAYHHNVSSWVLGQVASSKEITTGVTEFKVEFDPITALPLRKYGPGTDIEPGLLAESRAYYPDGRLNTVTDGRGKTTTLGPVWHRGVPKLITFADDYSISAEVNDQGWITSVTDQNGYKTSYDYDDMGRLELVTPPSGDHVAWAPTEIRFEQASDDPHNIGAGHWRRIESRGTYRKETYYNAYWQPVIEREYDTADVVGTQRYRGWTYDHDGRVTFEGYPLASASSIASFGSNGISTRYDALGRVEEVSQHSELGALITRTEYLPGFQVRVTNPRLFSTTTSYQVFDTPDTGQPVLIQAPEGATTTIVRDIFGKPKSIRRSGLYGGSAESVTRSYVYDAHQRLCKMIEPETGSTVMDYDAAGNLQWSASGLALPSTSECDRTHSSVTAAKVQRTYDNVNRLDTLSFPGGLGDQDWDYYPDGLTKRIETANADAATVINEYTYNKLRLLRTDRVSQAGRAAQTITLDYTANGHLKSVTHPSLLVVEYAPNALGQATQASQFATDVSYWPNGALQAFAYGNGLVHTLVQNARGLPESSYDAAGSTVALNDTYQYDHNGNVAAITDALSGGRGNRNMLYDGLDRLIQTVSPMFGTATYRYDPLDNLRTLSLSGGAKARNYTYIYDPTQRLERVQDSLTAATVHSYGYDVQGNLARKDGQSFLFDYGNRLRDVTGVEAYRYDGHGRRVRSAHATQGDIYSLYGQDGVLRNQRDERAGKDTDFIYLSGSLIAQVETPIAPPVVVPTISISNTALTEGNSGTRQATLTVSLSQSTTVPVTFNYASANGSATAGSDYVAKSGTGSIPAGSTSTTVSVTINGDTAVEGNETFAVALSNVSGATLGTNPGTVTIVNDDAVVPTISINSTSVVEGDGDSAVTLTVSLSQSTTVPVTFNYASANGSALEPADYIMGSASNVQIEPGQTTRQISFTVKGDTAAESSEDFTVSLSNVSGATIGTGTGKVTIVNDDIDPPQPPSVPAVRGYSHTAGGASYTATWPSAAGATKYTLQEQVNGGTWTNVVSNTTAFSRSLSSKAKNVYGYRLRACNNYKCSGYSGVSSISVHQIKLTDTNKTVTSQVDAPGTASASFRLASAGKIRFQTTVGGSWVEQAPYDEWLEAENATSAAYFQVRATKLSGATPTGTLGSWKSLGSTADWTLPNSSAGTLESVIKIEIRETATGQVLDSENVTLRAIVNAGGSVPAVPADLEVMQMLRCEASWSASAGASSYELKANSTTVYSGSGTYASPGKYCASQYTVRACNASGCSAWSAPAYPIR